jgi:hypothetical protein
MGLRSQCNVNIPSPVMEDLKGTGKRNNFINSWCINYEIFTHVREVLYQHAE